MAKTPGLWPTPVPWYLCSLHSDASYELVEGVSAGSKQGFVTVFATGIVQSVSEFSSHSANSSSAGFPSYFIASVGSLLLVCAIHEAGEAAAK